MMNKYLKYIFAISIYALLFWISDPADLIIEFSKLTAGAIVVLVLISVILIYISALKWKLFISASGHEVSAIKLFNYYLLGYFINLLVPSYIGGDAVRSWYAGKHSTSHDAFAATILERYTGFVAMLLLGILSVFILPGLPFFVRATIVLMFAGLCVLTVLMLSGSLIKLCSKLPWLRTRTAHIVRVQDIIRTAFRNKKLLLKAFLLSLLFHVFTVVNTQAAAYAIGCYDIPTEQLFAVLPIILLIGALPITPSGLGIQEGAFTYFLTMLGATNSAAFSIGLILRAKIYLIALVGGFVWLAEKKSQTKKT